MKRYIKIVLILISLLLLFFCISGFVMIGSFSVAASIEQKEHYILVQTLYKLGIIVSVFILSYVTFFIKNKH